MLDFNELPEDVVEQLTAALAGEEPEPSEAPPSEAEPSPPQGEGGGEDPPPREGRDRWRDIPSALRSLEIAIGFLREDLREANDRLDSLLDRPEWAPPARREEKRPSLDRWTVGLALGILLAPLLFSLTQLLAIQLLDWCVSEEGLVAALLCALLGLVLLHLPRAGAWWDFLRWLMTEDDPDDGEEGSP